MYDEEGAGSISAFQFALALVAQCPPREFPAFVDRAEELRDSQLCVVVLSFSLSLSLPLPLPLSPSLSLSLSL